MAIDDLVHRFTTGEYAQLVESGALEDVRAELLDGLLVDKMTQGPRHAAVIRRLTVLFAARAELLHVQLPLAIEEGWAPEPDLALAAPPPPGRHPHTADVVVEVAASGLQRAHRKAPAYARASVGKYWIVDIEGDRVLEHTRPGPEGYEVVSILTGADVLDTGVEGVPATTVAALVDQ